MPNQLSASQHKILWGHIAICNQLIKDSTNLVEQLDPEIKKLQVCKEEATQVHLLEAHTTPWSQYHMNRLLVSTKKKTPLV
jgi:hypothetical protein